MYERALKVALLLFFSSLFFLCGFKPYLDHTSAERFSYTSAQRGKRQTNLLLLKCNPGDVTIICNLAHGLRYWLTARYVCDGTRARILKAGLCRKQEKYLCVMLMRTLIRLEALVPYTSPVPSRIRHPSFKYHGRREKCFASF